MRDSPPKNEMSGTFVIGLVLTGLGVLQLWLDHGDTVEAIKEATEPRLKKRLKARLIIIWGVFSLGLLTMVFSKVESDEADAALSELTAKLNAATNQVAVHEDKLKPRTITEEQAKKFKQSLAGVPTGKIGINLSLTAGPEAGNFADMLGPLLMDCGFKCHKSFSELGGLAQQKGLWIGVRSAEAQVQPVYAAPIQRALSAIGYNAGGFVVPGVPTDEIVIQVGAKD